MFKDGLKDAILCAFTSEMDNGVSYFVDVSFIVNSKQAKVLLKEQILIQGLTSFSFNLQARLEGIL